MRYRDSESGDVTGDQSEADGPEFSDSAPCVECKYAEARRTNEFLDNSSNDDQVRTFYTEGTPYLSTATSLTDLTKARGEDDDDDEKG